MYALAQTPANHDHPDFIDLLEKIIPFISSSTSLIYQIKSELEAILIVLEKSTSIPLTTVNSQIDGMKFRLSNYLEISNQDLIQINKLIDKIVLARTNRKIELIEDLINKIKHYINYNTISYMNEVGINPPPAFILPDTNKYGRTLVRTPDSAPINPLKLAIQDLNVNSGSGITDNDPSQALANLIMEKNTLYD